MARLTEETIASRTVFDGRIIKVREDTVMLENGRQASREVVDHNGGCCVCAVTEDNEVLLVKQFRYPYKEAIYEIPAGKLEKGEDPAVCAARELEEETGYRGVIEFIGKIYPSPGYTSEVIYLFSARDLVKAEQHLDEDEFLDAERIPLDTAMRMIADNDIKDSKTIIGIYNYYINSMTRKR